MWNDLGLIDKARMIQLAVKSGITDLRTIEEVYNTYASGGPLPLNSYAGGGDFETIKERPDYKANTVQRFIQDVIGPMYYPHPVDVHGDYSRFYFGRPTEKDTFYKSKYRPTKSSDNDVVYYGVKDPIFLNDLVHLYNTSIQSPKDEIRVPVKPLLNPGDSRVLNGYLARVKSVSDSGYIGDTLERHLPGGDSPISGISVTNYPLTDSVGALGNFTVSRGNDDIGDYLSYYDKWDLNGFTNITEKVENYGIGKPYEIYDRIYGTFDDDGTFHPSGELPSAIVYEDSFANGGLLANLYTGGGGLSRSKDYKSSKKPYPSVKSGDFAGGGRSYPIPTKADAVDALRLAGLHHRPDVKAKVYSKYPSLKHANGGPLENEGGYTSSLSSRERVNTLFDPSWGFGLEGAISRLIEGGNKSHGEENEYWRAYLGLPNKVPKMNPNAKTEWDDVVEEEKLSRGELPSDFYGTTPRMDQMIQAVADTANTGRILRNYDYYKEQIPSLAEKYVIQHMYNQGKRVMENPNKWTQVTEGPQIYLYDKVGADTNEKVPLGMLADFGMMWSPDEGVLRVHDTYNFPNYVTALSSIPKRPKEMKIRGKINYDPQKGSILLRDSIPDTQKVAPPVIIRKSE